MVEQRELAGSGNDRRAALLEAPAGSAPKVATGGTSSGAFQMVFQHRYLLLVALFSLVFSWVNTNGEYMLGKLIKADAIAAVQRGVILEADVGAHIGAAYGQFFFYVNVLGVLLQTFVVSRLVRWLGLSVAFLILPVVALGDASAVALLPLLWVIRLGKLAENALDYSLNNTLRQMLWLVTTRDMKYKAKQAIDTFFVRLGDVSSALSVWILISLLHFPVQRFALVSVILVAVWLTLAVLIGRSHRQRSLKPEVET
jgi:AAA family ATP:ADP antiporter